MNVRIIKMDSAEQVAALIKEGKVTEMPSLQHNWRFNFSKELKKLRGATGYLLVTEETPHILEGCMIFLLKDTEIPYMAYLEVAPHNRGHEKKYGHVAGCLIAFAYQLSLIFGRGDYRGMLFFDVLEEEKENEVKLMSLYSSKYKAKRLDRFSSTMVLMDEDGDALVAKYLS